MLSHPDPNVQFFGAHTAQVKIVRDWCGFLLIALARELKYFIQGLVSKGESWLVKRFTPRRYSDIRRFRQKQSDTTKTLCGRMFSFFFLTKIHDCILTKFSSFVT